MFKVKAEQKEIKLFNFVDKNIPKTFVTDEQKVKQIIINLVGNSIKYTFGGKITIKADLIN